MGIFFMLSYNRYIYFPPAMYIEKIPPATKNYKQFRKNVFITLFIISKSNPSGLSLKRDTFVKK